MKTKKFIVVVNTNKWFKKTLFVNQHPEDKNVYLLLTDRVQRMTEKQLKEFYKSNLYKSIKNNCITIEMDKEYEK